MHTQKVPLNHIILKLIFNGVGIDHKDGKALSQNIAAFLGLELETSG